VWRRRASGGGGGGGGGPRYRGHGYQLLQLSMRAPPRPWKTRSLSDVSASAWGTQYEYYTRGGAPQEGQQPSWRTTQAQGARPLREAQASPAGHNPCGGRREPPAPAQQRRRRGRGPGAGVGHGLPAVPSQSQMELAQEAISALIRFGYTITAACPWRRSDSPHAVRARKAPGTCRRLPVRAAPGLLLVSTWFSVSREKSGH